MPFQRDDGVWCAVLAGRRTYGGSYVFLTVCGQGFSAPSEKVVRPDVAVTCLSCLSGDELGRWLLDYTTGKPYDKPR